MCGNLFEDKQEDGKRKDYKALEVVHNVSYKGRRRPPERALSLTISTDGGV